MSSRGLVFRRGVSAATFLIHLALLAVLVAGWWAHRENHLFADGRWLAGKDLGKFVFYTYEFLFHPLDTDGVDLAGHMGFQEILHREPEGPGRRLRRVAFGTRVSDGAYLWIELRVRGPRRLAFRLSRNSLYPSGTYAFSDQGERTRFAPFAEGTFRRGFEWRQVELHLANGRWEIQVDGERLDAVEDVAWTDGRLGFRGSGPAAGPVRVRDVRLTLEDDSGRTWIERSRWTPRPGRETLPGALAFAALVLVLRFLRREVFARSLVPGRRHAFLRIGDGALLAVLAVGVATGLPKSGSPVPGAVFGLEVLDLLVLAWCRRGREAPPLAIPPRLALATIGITIAVGVLAFTRQGEGLGRALPYGPPTLAFVHPDAYRIVPDREEASPPFELREPVTVTPGEPFFVPDHAWKEQEIAATVVLSPRTTLDLVFEQRSFRTLGDLAGEALPHSRRLVRLTTRDDVPTGLAVGTGNRPNPFRKADGNLVAGAGTPVELEIRSDGETVRLRVNGVETILAGVRSLGMGETGLLAYDGAAEVRALRVTPLLAPRLLGSWSVILAPSVLATLVWVLLGRMTTFRNGLALESAALFPLVAYAAAALVTSPGAWGLLGRDRFAWLDLAAAATLVSHVALLVVSRRRDARAIVLFNLLALGLVAAGALFVWDRLPESHALRLRFAGTALAPGETVTAAPGAGPWYTDDRSIGANTWVWRQEPGGESIAGAKAEGTVRIVVSGGSQAWGSGAASSAETFAELLEARLKDEGLPVEVFNAGINGAGISRVALAWEGLWRQLEPDVLVADVGLNDSAALRQIRDRARREPRIDALVADFERLLGGCRSDGVDVVLVHEPIAGEAPLRPVRRLYEAFAASAARFGVPVVDPRPTIRSRERDHLVWWDTAHFAPYGHSLMAEAIAPAVARVVRARLATSAAPNT